MKSQTVKSLTDIFASVVGVADVSNSKLIADVTEERKHCLKINRKVCHQSEFIRTFSFFFFSKDLKSLNVPKQYFQSK